MPALDQKQYSILVRLSRVGWRNFVVCLCLAGLVLSLKAQAQQPRSGRRSGSTQTELPDSSGVFVGQVKDIQTGDPVEFAAVTLLQAQSDTPVTGAMTDAEGRFRIVAPFGTYDVQVEFIGYRRFRIETQTLSAERRRQALGTLRLETLAVNLKEVEISGERSRMQFDLDKKVFNVGKDLSSVGGTAQDVLENVPSITTDENGNISLRGKGNVRILIDGKPSGLLGIGQSNALANLTADMIERVEIITQPSARYDAEGISGIINIVLKKEQRKGLNANLTAATGWPNNHNLGLSGNYRSGRWNFFGNVGLRYRSGIGNSYSLRDFMQNDTIRTLETDGDHERNGGSGFMRLGLEYALGERTDLSFSVNGSLGRSSNTSENSYMEFLGPEQQTYLGRSDRITDELEEENNTEAELSFIHEFRRNGQKLNVDVRYNRGYETEDADADNRILEGSGAGGIVLPERQRTLNVEDQDNITLQTDYIHPFNDSHRFETGYRGQGRWINTDFRVEDYRENTGGWATVPELSNTFEYDEWVHAFYGLYAGKSGQFSYQAGLRAEYTDMRTLLRQTNQETPRSYLDLFPSAHVSYDLGQENSLQLAYSRRIERPGFWTLNPFYNLNNPFSVRSGNPKVNPEYTHSTELGYLRRTKGYTINGSLYYRHTTGVIERISTINSEGVNFSLPYNVGIEDEVGIEAGISADPFSWWRLDVNFNGFYSDLRGIETSEYDVDIDFSYAAWNANTQSRFTLPHDITILWNVRYQSREQIPQGERRPVASTDLGVTKELFKGRGSLTFRVRDVFNSRRWVYEISDANFSRYGEYQRRIRTFILSFTYQLKNSLPEKGGPSRRGGMGGGDSE